MEKAQGMVQGCGKPGAAARSGYPRADQVGAGGVVQLHTDPREEHLYFRGEFNGGQLDTYRGRDRLGGDTLTQSPFQETVRDARRTPDKVYKGGKGGGKGRDDSWGGDDGGLGD